MDISSFLPSVSVLLWVGGGGLFLMVAFLWVFVFNKKGDFFVELFEERADESLVLMGSNLQCAVVRTKGMIEKWKILGTKIPPFEPKHKNSLIPYLDKKKDKVYLLRDKNGIIHVMKITLDEKQKNIVLLPDYRDPMNFVVTEYDERAKIKEQEAKWKEFQPMLVSIICLVAVVTTTVLIFQNANAQAGAITNAVETGIKTIDAHIAQYDSTIQKAAVIVTNQEVLDRTANWTTSTVPVRG